MGNLNINSLLDDYSRTRRDILLVLVWTALVATMFFLFYIFITQNSERIIRRNSSYAEDSAVQTVLRLNDQFKNAQDLIRTYAYFLSNNLDKPEIPAHLLKEMERNSPFDAVRFTNIEGDIVDSGGVVRDGRDRNFFTHGLQGQSGASVIFDSRYFHQTTINFYAPLYYKNRLFGVLHGAYLADKYLRHLLEATYFGVDANVFLCMPDGRIIASSRPNSYTGNIISALLSADVIDGETARKASELFKSGNGTLTSANNNDSIISIVRMPEYKYILVQTYPKDVTRNMIEDANKSGIQLAVSQVILFFCLALLWLLRNHASRKRLLAQNNERGLVINAINSMFAGRYVLCDLEKRTYEYIAGSRPEKNVLPITGPYDSMIDYQASLLVDEKEKKDFLRYFSVVSLRKRLVKTDYFIYECKVLRNETEEWENFNTICVSREDNKPVKVLFMRQNITDKKQRELRLQNRLSVMDRQERQYQLAVTANAMYNYEFNISRNYVEKDCLVELNGQKLKLSNLLDLNFPCEASRLFETMNNHVLPESREDFAPLLDMKSFIEVFNSGKKEIDVQFWADFGMGEMCMRMSFYMVRDERTHDIMAMAVARDITDQVRRQRAQTKALQDALNQARHANEAKSRFLSSMSHDIRTPMNAIIGFANIAVNHLDNRGQVSDCLTKVLSSSNHLLSLINDILDMSRIESGKLHLNEQECNLSELMHNLLNIIQPQIKAKQLRLFVKTFDVVNEDIYADPLKLNQIFINLLGNAVKYTPAGGFVSFSIRQLQDTSKESGIYVFEVVDNGIGMSSEFLEHIFEPFTRESTTTQSGIQGTGLGMAITRNIIDLMNGKVTVSSELGKGSVFTVTLQFRLVDKEVIENALEQLKNLRVLVVDDDFHVCESVAGMLKEIGLRSEWTTSGKHALELAKEASDAGDPYNTYILDWQMPGISGVETAKGIRAAMSGTVPIIILTAYDWTDIEEEALNAGITTFCAKPLFMSDLRAALLASHNLVQKEEGAQVENLDFGKKRILLVDDLEMNREIAEFILTENGFQVEMAPDGTDAVEMVNNSDEGYYDAILMDVQMPVMNGYEATRAIRNLARQDVRSMPIIAMTANALEEDKAAALKSGMNAHIAKPIDIKNFFEVMKTYFTSSAASRETEDA